MKKWLDWIRGHHKDWPVLVSVVIGFLNTEFAIPVILAGFLNLSGVRLGLAAGIWASSELSWWNYFSGWLFKKKIQAIPTVSEAIDMGQKVIDKFDLKEFLKPNPGDIYVVQQIKNFVHKHSIDNFDFDNYQNNIFFVKLVNFLKGVGYLLTCFFVFGVGLLPFFWIFSLMVCRLLKWRVAYLALFTSNFIKNYFLALVYDRVGFWPWFLSFLAFVAVLSYLLKKIIKSLKPVEQNSGSDSL